MEGKATLNRELELKWLGPAVKARTLELLGPHARGPFEDHATVGCHTIEAKLRVNSGVRWMY